MSALVAIVGRPNVGKSTIFNKFVRDDKSIVSDVAGVTRDRLYGVAETDFGSFTVIDTGGFETEKVNYQPFKDGIVWEQTCAAIDESDLVVFVFDGKVGVQPHDHRLVQLAKTLSKPVIYVVNKIDGKEREASAFEFYELGIESFICVSAAHNRGVVSLREGIGEKLQQMGILSQPTPADSKTCKVALIGRPNAGKSSILNRLVGSDRSLVSDVPGTTRDPIDIEIKYKGQRYTFVDTAGIRRRTKIERGLEQLSVIRSLRVIEDADIVVVVVDAVQGLTDQDARLAALAAGKYKPVIFVINKWDLFPDKESSTLADYTLAIQRRIKSLSFAPVLFTSCLTGQRVHRILEEIHLVYQNYASRVPTAALNEAIQDIIQQHTPALMKGHRRLKFYYATQVRSCPPTIVVKCNVAEEIQESYKRYMTNRIRKDLGFKSIPINIIFRGKSDKQDSQPRT